MFEILSRFDLRADQVCSIVSEDRENVSITASIAEMKENPYIIFEQYIGYDSDDVIPFYRIDNGVIPLRSMALTRYWIVDLQND